MLRKIPKTVWLLSGVFIAIIVPFLLFETEINAWANGFATASDEARLTTGTLLFLTLAGDIVLPAPSSLLNTLCGMLFGLTKGFLLAFMAMNVSCILGFWLGRCCAPRARRLIGAKESAALELFFTRYGAPVLIAMRTVPVLAEASVLFAGLSNLSLKRATLYLLPGNAIVAFVYAWVGAQGQSTDSMLPAFLISLSVSAILLVASIWVKRRHGLNESLFL